MKKHLSLFFVIIFVLLVSFIPIFGVNETCTDTDGGYEEYIKGKVTSCAESDCVEVIDTCADSRYNNILIEYYCFFNRSVSTNHTCYYGCEDGACLTYSQISTTTVLITTIPTQKICTDSDGGLDYYVKGCVSSYFKTGYAGGGGGGCDRCLNSSTLSEQYCDENNNGNFTYYTCPYDCEDGVCLEEVTTTTTTTITTILLTTTTTVPTTAIQTTTTIQEVIEEPKKPNIFVRIYQRITSFFRILLGKWYKVFV